MAGLLDLLNEIMRAKGPRQQNVPEGYGSLLSQFDAHANALNDAGAQQLQKQGLLGMNASDAFHAVANPDAVLNSNVANAAMGFSPLGMAGVMTYHGTPHKFDKYDLSKVGTGQGAQSYGHGVYFAENPETANSYHQNLAVYPEMSKGFFDAAGNPSREKQVAGWIDSSFGDTKSLTQYLKVLEPKASDVQIKQWIEGGRKIHAEAQKAGAVYKQDLPDEVLPKMLQWDKPMSEQPSGVRQAIVRHVQNMQFDPFDSLSLAAVIGKHPRSSSYIPTGAEIFNELGNNKTAAETLQSLGIPGLSYLDAGSRGSGSGTRNYVIWDQGLLDRMKPSLVE